VIFSTKYFILFLSLALSSNLLAYPKSCELEISQFGDGQGHDKISAACIKAVKDAALGKVNRRYTTPSEELVGGTGIIVYENGEGKQFISAGSEAAIGKTISLILDRKSIEMVSLNSDGVVSFFSSKITGNVSPFRVIKKDELAGSIDLAINNPSDEVLILNPKAESVCIYSRLANSLHREGRRNDEVKRCITSLPVGVVALTVTLDSGEIALLNNQTGRLDLYSYDTEDFRSVPNQSLKVNVANPLSVTALADNQVIVTGGVKGKEYKVIKLKK